MAPVLRLDQRELTVIAAPNEPMKELTMQGLQGCVKHDELLCCQLRGAPCAWILVTTRSS